MSDFLLTAKELEAIPMTNLGGNVDDLNIAKAEAKKLVEWLDETYNSLKAQGGFQINQKEWQAIKKEVEDG